MAIRKDLVWRVGEDGVTFLPAKPQDGGVQGEDKAVRAKFILGKEHPLVTGAYQLYIECVDATGGYDKTEPLEPDEEGAIAAEIPLAWTQYGGTIRLNVAAEGEKERVLLDAVQVTFRSRPGVLKKMQLLITTYIQKLLNRADETLQYAEAAKESAVTSAAQAVLSAQGAQNAAATAATAAQGAQGAAQTATTGAGEATSAAAAAALARSEAGRAAEAAADSAAEAEKARKNAAGAVEKCSEYAMRAEESVNEVEKTAGELTDAVRSNGLSMIVEDDGEGNVVIKTVLGGGAGGGGNILIVTCENDVASHTPEEIYAHVQNGGYVMLLYHEVYYGLAATYPGTAEFSRIMYDLCVDIITVSDDGSVECVEDFLVSATWAERLDKQVKAQKPLIVEYDGQEQVTHTATQIYEHITNGGMAVMICDEMVYPLMLSVVEYAIFGVIADDNIMTRIEVVNDRAAYLDDVTICSGEVFAEEIGNINKALNSIIAIQESLIGGDGE